MRAILNLHFNIQSPEAESRRAHLEAVELAHYLYGERFAPFEGEPAVALLAAPAIVDACVTHNGAMTAIVEARVEVQRDVAALIWAAAQVHLEPARESIRVESGAQRTLCSNRLKPGLD